MALTVETGTGLEDADSFITLAFFQEYAGKQGWSLTGQDDTAQEQAIRRGTRHISSAFTFKGYRRFRVQSLAWPRSWVTDDDGYAVDADIVPMQVREATAEAAWRELQAPNSLAPDVTMTDRIKSERVGPLFTTYADTAMTAGASRPDIKIFRDLMRGLLAGGGGTTLVRS